MIKKKLHELGINTFEQVAAFDADDVERISAELDFRGRIEREEWVEQAKGFAEETRGGD